MADYNFVLARQIINSCEELDKAMMGMHEDWFWTAETIWSKEFGYSESFENGKLGGLTGSQWATPVLHLIFKDGREKIFECYTGIIADKLQQIEKEMFWTTGVLSRPIQEHRDNLNIEKPPLN